MSSRASSIRMVGLPVLTFVVLIVTTILAAASGGRVRIDSELLARSRGNNPNSVPGWNSCAQLSGINPVLCWYVGQNCLQCQVNNFQMTIPGSNGGWTSSSFTQTCGLIFNGQCDYNVSTGQWTCTGDFSNSSCQQPPNLPAQQGS
jgi:hypothetical protein